MIKHLYVNIIIPNWITLVANWNIGHVLIDIWKQLYQLPCI